LECFRLYQLYIPINLRVITCYDKISNYMTSNFHDLFLFILQQLIQKLRFLNFQLVQILGESFSNCVVEIEQ